MAEAAYFSKRTVTGGSIQISSCNFYNLYNIGSDNVLVKNDPAASASDSLTILPGTGYNSPFVETSNYPIVYIEGGDFTVETNGKIT